MAQSIKNLAVGSKIQDSKGNRFIVVAHNHYATNQVTLLSEYFATELRMSSQTNTKITYPNTEVAYFLKYDYLPTLDDDLVANIQTTSIQYISSVTSTQSSYSNTSVKAFLLSLRELGLDSFNNYKYKEGNPMDYLVYNLNEVFDNTPFWTRTVAPSTSNYKQCHMARGDGYVEAVYPNTHYYPVFPAFNVDSSILVSDNVTNGYYRLSFNEPPVIQNISNINGNYGSATKIVYTATDVDDTKLTHYISLNNGDTWSKINPTKKGNVYTYSHVFNATGTYYCRIKVVDSAENATVSNGFTVTVNASSPTINIVSVVDKVITFKVNCLTHDISKVEILVNDSIVKTYSNGFNFNLVYELDKTLLNTGKNSIQIKATSTGNLYTYRDLEANKTTYNLPPVGTKVVINNQAYTITNAQQVGANQVYTLERNLESDISKGQEIRIEQDSVKVLCSLSNLEGKKDFKEMKLIKSKKLKGMFEGYVEEKYELESEGRYSAIKLETERFNNNVASEIIELQQYFDYTED